MDLDLHRGLLLLRRHPVLDGRHRRVLGPDAHDGHGQAALPDRPATLPPSESGIVTPASAWVVGAGGLLGSSVAEALPRFFPGSAAWTPAQKFSWSDPAALEAELAAASKAFLAASKSWMVLWCAGAGVVGTSAEAMARETRAFQILLEALGGSRQPGLFFLASSAGGVYGGSRSAPLTEDTAPSPVSDYGRAKLQQEEILAAWAAARPEISTLTGRISNLYGPGQNLSKPQG